MKAWRGLRLGWFCVCCVKNGVDEFNDADLWKEDADLGTKDGVLEVLGDEKSDGERCFGSIEIKRGDLGGFD